MLRANVAPAMDDGNGNGDDDEDDGTLPTCRTASVMLIDVIVEQHIHIATDGVVTSHDETRDVSDACGMLAHVNAVSSGSGPSIPPGLRGASGRRGFPVVLSAASGTGKTTLSHLLLEGERDLVLSISTTTRKPRGNEEHG